MPQKLRSGNAVRKLVARSRLRYSRRFIFFCASAFDTGSCQQFAGLLRVRLDTPARRNIS